MKIAIIGSGAAGSVFASYLKLGGADLYLVDINKEHMDKVAGEGMTFSVRQASQDVFKQKITGFHTAYSAENIGTMDIVILLVKTTLTDIAMRGAMACIGSETVVVSLQNGLGNELKLQEYVSADKIMYGSGVITTDLPEPGVCVAMPAAPGVLMYFGALEKNEHTDKIGNYLKETFKKGGCQTEFVDDIAYSVWSKAMRNCAANALIGIMRLPAYYLWCTEEIVSIIKGIWREGCNIAEANGVDGEKLWNYLISTLEYDYSNMKNAMSSTAQDMLLYHKETEIDSLNGAIVAYGKRVGIVAPVNETITNIVKGIQRNYEVQFRV